MIGHRTASYHAVIALLEKDISDHRAEIVSRQAQIDETQHTITVLHRRLSEAAAEAVHTPSSLPDSAMNPVSWITAPPTLIAYDCSGVDMNATIIVPNRMPGYDNPDSSRLRDLVEFCAANPQPRDAPGRLLMVEWVYQERILTTDGRLAFGDIQAIEPYLRSLGWVIERA